MKGDDKRAAHDGTSMTDSIDCRIIKHIDHLWSQPAYNQSDRLDRLSYTFSNLFGGGAYGR